MGVVNQVPASVATSETAHRAGKVTYNGGSICQKSVSSRIGTAPTRPAIVPAEYPQPFNRHQYQRSTFGTTKAAPSAIISQSHIWRIESDRKPMPVPTSTTATVAT